LYYPDGHAPIRLPFLAALASGCAAVPTWPASCSHTHSAAALSRSPVGAASFIPTGAVSAAPTTAALRSRGTLERDVHRCRDGVEVECQANVVPERDDEFRGVDRSPCRHVARRLPGEANMLFGAEKHDIRQGRLDGVATRRGRSGASD